MASLICSLYCVPENCAQSFSGPRFEVIKGHCLRHGVADAEASRFFNELQTEAFAHADELLSRRLGS